MDIQNSNSPSKALAYFELFIAITFEIIATALLAESARFTKPLQSIATVICFVLSYYLFSIVIETIPVGLAYGVWSAAGTVMILTWGAVAYKQIPDKAATIGSILIIIGVVVANGFSDIEN